MKFITIYIWDLIIGIVGCIGLGFLLGLLYATLQSGI